MKPSDLPHVFMEVAGSLLLIGGVIGTIYLYGARHEAEKLSPIQDHPAIQTILKQDAADQKQTTARVIRDVKREQALQAQVDDLKATNLFLQATLHEKDSATPDCVLSLGNVRLLNAGKDGAGHSEQVSDPASSSAYEERTPSTVTCEDLIADDIDVSTRYNALRAKSDAQSEWMTKELVEPMQAEAASSK